ncbi:hypothetical protein BJV82DRAFT_622537 [Fennellomyces sp. T-0311]|nr:hypothetical protein BJV82DRAFT_622537 [Fennellomyces sp. T-0311]
MVDFTRPSKSTISKPHERVSSSLGVLQAQLIIINSAVPPVGSYKDLHRPTLSFEQRLAQLHQNNKIDDKDDDDDGLLKMFDSESIFDTSLPAPPADKVVSRKTPYAANMYDDPAEDEVGRGDELGKKKPTKKGKPFCRRKKKKRKRRSSKRATKKVEAKWTDPGRLRPRPLRRPACDMPKPKQNTKQRPPSSRARERKKDTE